MSYTQFSLFQIIAHLGAINRVLTHALFRLKVKRIDLAWWLKWKENLTQPLEHYSEHKVLC